MDPKDVVSAVLAMWEELPELAGDDWPLLHGRLYGLLERFTRAVDENARAEVAMEICESLESLAPRASQAIEGRAEVAYQLKDLTVMRGDGPVNIPLRLVSLSDLRDAITGLLRPAPVTRYTDVQAPARVTVGKRAAVVVGLTRQPSPDSPVAEPVAASVARPIEVTLMTRDFDVLTEPRQVIEVASDNADSSRATFFIRARQPGAGEITLDLWQDGQALWSTTLSIEAVATDVPEQMVHVGGSALNAQSYPLPHPDLVLRAVTSVREGETHIDFELRYPDTDSRAIKGIVFKGNPQAYWLAQIGEIENLARGLDVDGKPLSDHDGQGVDPGRIIRGLERVGRRLYEQLLSPELRQAYAQLKRERSIRTLMVYSDEPWIPWELIKPFDAVEGLDEDFFCAQYAMSRWIIAAGGPGVVPAVSVPGLACIAPVYPPSGPVQPLPFAQAEREFVQSLATKRGLADHTPPSAVRSAVEGLLESDRPIGLWHFAGHGDFNPQNPDRSPFLLESDRRIYPQDIQGMKTHLYAHRPLVFMNACRTGTSGLSVSGMGGWASAMVSHCGSGTFVAPLWSVNDRLAYELCRRFYERLMAGDTLGEAMLAARQHAKKLVPFNPTWLAYSLYGHPNAIVPL